jgi:hypothetical protein
LEAQLELSAQWAERQQELERVAQPVLLLLLLEEELHPRQAE